MADPTFFTVIGDYKSVVADSVSDTDADPQLGPVTATVTFTPMLRTGDVILAEGATPRPTGFVPAPIVARIDTDGRVKLRDEPDLPVYPYANLAAFPATGIAGRIYRATNTGLAYRWNGSAYVATYDYTPVRLLADTPLLNLAGPLFYQVSFTNVQFNGARGTINGFIFQAPEADQVINLIDVGAVAGATVAGITRGPRGWRSRLVPITSGPDVGKWQWIDEIGEPFGTPVDPRDVVSEELALPAIEDAVPPATAAYLAGLQAGFNSDGYFTVGGNPTAEPPLEFLPAGLFNSLAGKPALGASGVVGNGIVNDRAALASSDSAAALAGLPMMLLPGVYKVSSNLTITSPVWFTPGAIIKPDNGVTVTLAGGMVAPPQSKLFDISAGGVVIPRRVPHVTPYWWGAVGNGVVDDSAAVNGAIAAAVKEGGGTVYIPTAIFRCDSQLRVPTDASTPPRMGNIRIVGDGFHSSGQDGATTPTQGSILDLRYNADPAQAKLITTGFGSLELTGLTWTDSVGSGNSPYVKTTNTTLHAHLNSFIGSPSRHRTTCDQDAFILGGTDTTTPPAPDYTTTDNGPFQGYGTVIEKNYFGRIRRAVLGQTYANAVVVQNNNIWNTCGSNLTDGAAIEFIGHSATEASGNYISGNLIEMPGYKYGMQFIRSHQNIIIGNGCYDSSEDSIAAVHFGTAATWNFLIDGFTSHGLIPVVDDTGNNTRLGLDDSALSLFRNPVTFRRLVSLAGIEAAFRWYDNDGTTPIAEFSDYGRKWKSLGGVGGAGQEMTIDTGTGGNYATARCLRLRTKRYDTNAPAIGLAVQQPTDGSLANGECGVYWDASTGTLSWRGKTTGGTVVQGSAGAPLSTTATVDFLGIPAQSHADRTITVTGAAVGDAAQVVVPAASAVAGIIYTARVSSANTVTVRAFNITSAEIDPPSGDFKAVVFR